MTHLVYPGRLEYAVRSFARGVCRVAGFGGRRREV